MYLEDKIGSIAPGMEADIVVLDMKSTPIIEYRMQFAKDFEEALFIQMTLGDDRAVQATYVAGNCSTAVAANKRSCLPRQAQKSSKRGESLVAHRLVNQRHEGVS